MGLSLVTAADQFIVGRGAGIAAAHLDTRHAHAAGAATIDQPVARGGAFDLEVLAGNTQGLQAVQKIKIIFGLVLLRARTLQPAQLAVDHHDAGFTPDPVAAKRALDEPVI